MHTQKVGTHPCLLVYIILLVLVCTICLQIETNAFSRQHLFVPYDKLIIYMSYVKHSTRWIYEFEGCFAFDVGAFN